jgi:aldose 1-epimerase
MNIKIDDSVESNQQKGDNPMSVQKSSFGQTSGGQDVDHYSLVNGNGCKAGLITFGAALQELWMPDRKGQLDDVVLGYPDMVGYSSAGNPRHGAVIGRVANRVSNGRFELDGQIIELSKNKAPNHMHGGFVSFDKKVWVAEILDDGDEPAVRFVTVSPDGEEGYPGTCTTALIYTLTRDNALRLDYEAIADKDTAINLTNHAYFNLSGHNQGNILNHVVSLAADAFTVIDSNCYPTGEIRPVAGTALDFTSAKPIGQDIDRAEEQILFANGYDHNFVLRGDLSREGEKQLKACAWVEDPASGRTMTVETTSQGVQFFTPKKMRPGEPGKGGIHYDYRCSFCLETQYFPDALNHPNFPSAIFRVGETYRHTTIYRFGSKSQANS